MFTPLQTSSSYNVDEFEQTFSRYNFRLINLNLLIQKPITVKLLDDLYTLRIIPRKTFNPLMYKFFYHYLLSEICNQILSKTVSEKCIICYSPNNFDSNVKFELFEHLPKEKTEQNIQKYLKHIEKYLPIKIFQSKHSFMHLNYHISERTGEGIEVITQLQQLIQQKKDNFSFENVIKHAHKMELRWFSKFLCNTHHRRRNRIWYS